MLSLDVASSFSPFMRQLTFLLHRAVFSNCTMAPPLTPSCHPSHHFLISFKAFTTLCMPSSVHLLSSLLGSELQEGKDQAHHHTSSTENSILYVEVWKSSETNPMKTSKGYAFRIRSNKESATITCVLAGTQSQAEEWEHSVVGKRQGFRCTLMCGHWHGEARGGPTRRGTYVIG